MTFSAMQDAPTIRTIGKYKIIGTLGRGSMGVVYRAQDPEIGRIVAIKVIRNTATQQPLGAEIALERFKVEARAAGNLRHPHIITVFDVNIEQDSPYIVMDFIEGESLSQLLSRNSKLDPRQAMHLLWQIASGLDHAHSRGVIHRDIKPSNILIDKSETAFILDFGVASFGEKTKKDDMLLGTPSYMSPELIVSKETTTRSDLFSFAVMAFECFTGVKPFPGENFSAVVNNILNSPALLLSDLNPELPMTLEVEFEKALAKQPENRFSSAEHMVSAFSNALGMNIPASGAYVSSSSGTTRKRKMSDWRSLESIKDAMAGLPDKVNNSPRERKKSMSTLSPWRPPEQRNFKIDAFAINTPVAPQEARPGSMYETVDDAIPSQPELTGGYRLLTFTLSIVCLGLSALIAWKIFFAAPDDASQIAQSDHTIDIEDVQKFDSSNGRIEIANLPKTEPVPVGKPVIEMNDKQILGVLISEDSPEGQTLEAMREARRRSINEVLDISTSLLRRDSYIIRIETLKMLADMADPKVVPQVVAALDDHDPLVRRWSAKALAKIGDRRAVGYLQARLLREDLDEVKNDLRKAIEKITGIPYAQ